MMSLLSMGLFTLIMLPVYLALRYTFFSLPLHIDTGFYVSNHTICTRKIDFSQGWNAYFGGCSKLLPEMFYSLIYLLHGGMQYKFYARFYYSLYNYTTAILVGYTAYVLGGHSGFLYYAGLIVYCLISSEPRYGVYFESAEQFELPFQVIGFLLIFIGTHNSNPYFVAIGFGIWIFDGFFIKLSSLISSCVLFLAIGLNFSKSLPYTVAAGLVVCGLCLAWVSANKIPLVELVKPLMGHEYHFGHHLVLKAYAKRLRDKVRFLWRIARVSPLVPGLAVLGGLIVGHDRSSFVLIYLGAVVLPYFFQAARVWYHTIPLLPPISILAGFGVEWLSSQGRTGLALILLLAIVWLSVHLAQSYGRLFVEGIASLNRYSWRPYRVTMAEKNLQLEQIAPALRAHVGRRSFFVSGAWNQAYVLVESSYDTPLISAAPWLDDMMPGWQRVLNERFLRDAPEFLLDTDSSLDVEVIKNSLGLDYRLIGTFDSNFRLYVLNGSVELKRIDLDCKPFHPRRDYWAG